MFKYFGQKFFNGIFFGFVISLTFGVFLLVRAQIIPGEVTNPTFGPQQDDVSLIVPFNCVRVSTWGTAVCPAGLRLVGGGGDCINDGDNPDFEPNLTTNSYSAWCDGGGAQAYAICCQ